MKRSIAALITVLAVVAAGCGDDDVSDATTPAPPASEAPAGTTATTEPAAEQPTATTAAPTGVGSTETGTLGSDYLGSYTLVDNDFGTMVTVTVEGGTRTIMSNSLPNHDTGEFPNAGNPNAITEQSLSYSFTTDPVFTGAAAFAQTPGVAVNGVAFEPETAETVTCSSGEVYRIEALQELYNLGLDFNNAHVQPNGQYHYHGVSSMLVDAFANGDDLVHIGFAADGHLMYYSKSGAYPPSYRLSTAPRTGTGCTASGPAGGTEIAIDGSSPDGTYISDWEFDASLGALDSCNGVEIDGEYVYFLTDGYPFISRCLNGEFTETRPGGGGALPGEGQGGGGGQGAP